MAIDLTKGSHKRGFLNKVASAQTGSPHVFNVTLAQDHDNFDLVVRGDWKAFDNYEEDTAATVSFSGIVREKTSEGTWYIEVVSSNALLVYNSPVSPYPQQELQDEELFYNLSGETSDGLSLISGDIYSVSENGFSKAPTAGDTVSYADGKYVIA